MKHIRFIIIGLCLLLVSGMQAQMPQGRTTSTIIADALAQLPAETPESYNQTIADLVSTGEEGLLDLIGRMNPPGKETNESYEFAITGWTHSVAKDEPNRQIAADAFEKALQRPIDREVKAYVIRQLRTIGRDNNVELLSTFLQDDYLSSPSSMALVSIGTENASVALHDALKIGRAHV